MLFRFGARLGEFDTTALAAAAGVDLCLDDHNAVPCAEKLLRRGIGLLEGDGHLPVGHADAVTAKDVFGLVLVNLHARAPVWMFLVCRFNKS